MLELFLLGSVVLLQMGPGVSIDYRKIKNKPTDKHLNKIDKSLFNSYTL